MVSQNSCGALIKQLHDALEKSANNHMRADGITMTQCGALLALRDAPEEQMPLKELERALHVAQSTAAGVVARMEQKGLLEGFSDPDDRRVKMVRLTPAGRENCLSAERGMEQTEEQLLSGLNEEEREIFLRLLKRVRDSL